MIYDMKIKIFDTLSHSKLNFEPLNSKKIRMYVCGPTVYDFAHIGNGRPIIVFDVLFRLLRSVYGINNVSYVRNITDIDDKIIVAANKLDIEHISFLQRSRPYCLHTHYNYLRSSKFCYVCELPTCHEHLQYICCNCV